MMLFLCSDADVLSLPYTGYAHATMLVLHTSILGF